MRKPAAVGLAILLEQGEVCVVDAIEEILAGDVQRGTGFHDIGTVIHRQIEDGRRLATSKTGLQCRDVLCRILAILHVEGNVGVLLLEPLDDLTNLVVLEVGIERNLGFPATCGTGTACGHRHDHGCRSGHRHG